MAILSKGQQLKALIEQTGYSITTVSEKIGYSREHLSRLLKSDRVDETLVWKISRAVGVDLIGEVFPETKSHERDDCREEVQRLRAELDKANRAIGDLSATLRALSEKK